MYLNRKDTGYSTQDLQLNADRSSRGRVLRKQVVRNQRYESVEIAKRNRLQPSQMSDQFNGLGIPANHGEHGDLFLDHRIDRRETHDALVECNFVLESFAIDLEQRCEALVHIRKQQRTPQVF